MRDRRIQVFRAATEDLVESLEAVIRLSRWSADEPKPAPLVLSAEKLQDRLGAAERLSSAKFQGTPTEVDKVGAICTVLKGLDEAYVAYRRQLDSPGRGNLVDAVAALETKVAALVAESSR